MAACCIDEARAEVADHRSVMELHAEREEQEESQMEGIVEELQAENRRLHAATSIRWNSTRRLQASLRGHEDQVVAHQEELAELQRKLEQENSKLRKESSGMRARLLAWRQMQKRGASAPSGESAKPRAVGNRLRRATSPDGKSVVLDL